MKPKTHLILGTLFSIIFYLIYPQVSSINFILLWLSTWLLVDLDYPTIYALKNKDFNPRKFLDYYKKRLVIWKKLDRKEKRKFKYNIRFFHSLEFLVILIVFSLYFNFISYIILGFLFHMILDWIDTIHKKENILKKVSLIYVIIKNRGRDELKV